jgi:tetratricopeptide (TPR) repeat protein
LVRDAADHHSAWLARARTRATFHRFPEALGDLDAAGRYGADSAVLDAERAMILQTAGCHAEALLLRRAAAERRPDFGTLGALAGLVAELGYAAEAEELFTEARRRDRGVPPFEVATLDFRRGVMWLGAGHVATAAIWFDLALLRVPAYAPAHAHRAEVDAELGARQAGIDRLRPWARDSDDPRYAAQLAGLLGDAGRPADAEQWRVGAATRYDELVRRHPDAFTGHAAYFWLTVGGDPAKGLRLFLRDRASRVGRARAVLDRLAPPG